VLAALHAVGGRRPVSFDAPVPGTAPSEATLGSRLGDYDRSYDRAEYCETLRGLLAALPGPEGRAVGLRFFQELSQVQIAEQMGCSQMHVSRLLRRALARLCCGLLDDGPAPAPAAAS
jgi:RNA polymerase sigma-B factor